MEYDVVSGVSVGSINSLAMFLFDIGQEQNATDYLTTLWEHLKSSDVYENWNIGIIQGLIKESGVYNNQPLSDLLHKLFNDVEPGIGRKRMINVAAAEVNTGSYFVFTEKNSSDIVKSVVSSASIPFIFPHQVWPALNMTFMDGGTEWNTNLVSAVRRCREQGFDDSQVTIDILMCNDLELDKDYKDNALSNYFRFRDIRQYYQALADISTFKKAFPEVNYRYFAMPSTALKGGLKLLDFTNSTHTWAEQLIGRHDGANIIELGEGKSFERFDEYIQETELKKEFKTAGSFVHHNVNEKSKQTSINDSKPFTKKDDQNSSDDKNIAFI